MDDKTITIIAVCVAIGQLLELRAYTAFQMWQLRRRIRHVEERLGAVEIKEAA